MAPQHGTDDDAPVDDRQVASTPPSVAALRRSLDDLVNESKALRLDVASAEEARARAEKAHRRSSRRQLALLALVGLFVALMAVITWQNNQLARKVAETNRTMVDCTTPGGKCNTEANARTGQAIGDIIRGQAFLSECARLYPGDVGPEYDRKLEACVNERLADPDRNPRPGVAPQASPSIGDTVSLVPTPPPLDDGPQPQEPAVKVGSWATLTTTTIALLVALGVPISAELKIALLGFLVSVAPFVTAVIARAHVFSPESVRLLLAAERDKKRRSTPKLPHTPGGVVDAGGALPTDRHHHLRRPESDPT